MHAPCSNKASSIKHLRFQAHIETVFVNDSVVAPLQVLVMSLWSSVGFFISVHELQQTRAPCFPSAQCA